MTAQQRFGVNLKQLREAIDWSQEELAYRARIHRTQISFLESGKRSPGFFTLIKLAGALGVTPNDLGAGITWTPAEYRPGLFVVGEP